MDIGKQKHKEEEKIKEMKKQRKIELNKMKEERNQILELKKKIIK